MLCVEQKWTFLKILIYILRMGVVEIHVNIRFFCILRNILQLGYKFNYNDGLF